MSENENIEYKLIFLGTSDSGKKSFLKKLVKGEEYSEKNISTIGMDKRTLQIKLDIQEKDKTVTKSFDLSLIDTAGQERFDKITHTFYKEADGIILIYDVSNRESFIITNNWIESIYKSLGDQENSKYVFILIGNKNNLNENDGKKREISEEEAKKKCEEYNLLWGREINIKTINYNELLELFKGFVKKIYEKVGIKTKIKKYVVIKKISEKKKKEKKCE